MKNEERRLFTYKERNEILKSSYGKCASCGTKLTTKTMTVEHIIPVSRGGNNAAENLVALCKSCNTRKDNLLFTGSFYIALFGTPRLEQIRKHINKWFRSMKEEFDIEMFPFIAPISYCLFDPVPVSHRRGSFHFLPDSLYFWSLIGKDYYDEIEAVTDLNIRLLRQKSRELWSIQSFLTGKRDMDGIPIAIYSFRKYSNDKILAVATVSYIKELRKAIIYLPWCIVSKANQGMVLRNLITTLLEAVTITAGYAVDRYFIYTYYQVAILDFIRGGRNPFLGYEFTHGNYYDEMEDEFGYYFFMKRQSDTDFMNVKMERIREDFRKNGLECYMDKETELWRR